MELNVRTLRTTFKWRRVVLLVILAGSLVLVRVGLKHNSQTEAEYDTDLQQEQDQQQQKQQQEDLQQQDQQQQQQETQQQGGSDPAPDTNYADAYRPKYINLEAAPKGSQALFSVNTDHCKMPLLDPFDRRISAYLRHSVASNCAKYPPLFTSLEKGVLKLSRDLLLSRYNQRSVRCTYEVISRVNDTAVTFDPPRSFDADIQVEAEFMRVSCPLAANRTYRAYHAHTPRRPAVEGRCRPIQDLGAASDYLNVLLLGVDSMSRSNVVRQMPQTRDYLLKELQGVELLGYNKVGDNTLPNLLALLTGRFREDLLDMAPGRRHHFDQLPFVWKKFAKAGYRTLYAEDNPNHGNFNWLQHGFNDPPTDYYYRPYATALEADRALWWKRDCVGPETEAGLLLDYGRKFVSEFHRDKFFGLLYLSRLTHDDPNRAHAIDGLYKDFLKGLRDGKLLENTMVVFFSDHGARYGPLRGTDVGAAEERLPAVYLVLPEWFHSTYPDYMASLRTNQNRLTTPFDLYTTLEAVRRLDAASVLADREKKASVGKKPSGEKKKSVEREMNSKKKPSDEREMNSGKKTDSERKMNSEREPSGKREMNSEKKPIRARPAYSLFREVPPSRDCPSAHVAPHWCMCRTVEVLGSWDEVPRQGAIFVIAHLNNLLTSFPELCAELTLAEVTKAHLVHPGVMTQHSNLKTYQVTFTASPGEGVFEATLEYDVNTKRYGVTGVISRIDSYGTKSHCISDPGLKLYCHCKQQL